jgi:hypothetical protein
MIIFLQIFKISLLVIGGKVFDEFKASNREAGITSRAKGGRIGYKHGAQLNVVTVVKSNK